ncbi:hypothetical protein [Chryseobacterium indoltheticum]|uniref:hypothetical protein n=1 Tax=Chryseobacterium indoltheticum TaxID=254 RepID=UPI003F49A105
MHAVLSVISAISLGALMPEETKEELVQLLTYHNIPLIEDDLYGNLYFGTSRPNPAKYLMKQGLSCGAVLFPRL